MSVCAAAPSPCLPSKRRIDETFLPVFVTFRRFDVSTIRRIGGKAFRRQSVSAATFFAVSSARCDRIGTIMRCDARFGDSAAYPRRRIAEKRENRRKSPKRRKRSGRLENILNVRYCGVPRGTSISCSTWNADKLLSFNNLCKNVQNVHMIRSTYSDYKLMVISNLTF